MKIQDIVFLLVLAGLIVIRKPKIAVIVGCVALLVSMPLFYTKIALFTAQRLVQYGAAFFLLTILLDIQSVRLPHKK